MDPLKNDDLDLGQKVKILNFFIYNDESTGGNFFYMQCDLKVKRMQKKGENQEKKNFKFFNKQDSKN